MKNWKEYGRPFEEFTEERTQSWIEKGFSLLEVEEFIEWGFPFHMNNNNSLIFVIPIFFLFLLLYLVI